MKDSENRFRDVNTSLSAEDITMLSPLQLAYVGDAVYELLVRTYLLERGSSVQTLHRKATKLVSAKGQAEIIHNIHESLTDIEKSIVRRGRNTKTNTSPKNTNIIDYKYATGFEALIGFLYLTRQEDRINEIFSQIISIDIKQKGN